MIISLIVAHGKNLEIGLKNQLIWKIKDDLKIFKALTMNQTLIMGRKTFDSIGRILPHRKFIVITRQAKEHKEQSHGDSLLFMNSLQEALTYCSGKKINEVFIAGGGEIYREALPYAQKIYLSLIDYQGPADSWFPQYQLDDWKIVRKETYQQNEANQFSFSFLEMVKR